MKTMCGVLSVSESGYYAWCKREPSRRQLENERLTEQIRHAYAQGRQVYGSLIFTRFCGDPKEGI